jgi:hypothetical protein
MEGMVATPDRPGGSSYSSNRKRKGEVLLLMILRSSQRLVKNL